MSFYEWDALMAMRKMWSMQMTRLIFPVFLVLGSLPAYGAWVEVSVNAEAGETVYIDSESIRRRGDIAEMWVLYDSKTAQPAVGKTYLSRKVQNEYNCKQDVKRMVRVIEYSGNMATGTVIHMSSALFSPTEWKPVRSGLGETLLKAACGER